jgi:hypothetical protein
MTGLLQHQDRASFHYVTRPKHKPPLPKHTQIDATITPAKMFNALNRFISRLDGDTPSNKQNLSAFGFQVLRNENLQLGIEPWFDYIVGINGRMIVRPPPMPLAVILANVRYRMTPTPASSPKKSATAPAQA